MSDQVDAAFEVTDDGPAETATLLTPEVSETTEQQESPEQAETVEKAEGESQPAENQSEKAVAPESYEFTAPEGMELAKDSVVVAAYSEIAKSLDLSQEQAQEGFSKLAQAQRDQDMAAHAQRVEGWANETRNDSEIGGDKLDATLMKAKQAIATFGDEELSTLLDSTGLGNHRAIARFAAKARDAVADHVFVGGDGAEPARLPDARDMYPNSKMNP